MARGNNPALSVGDVLLDTTSRDTEKVLRLVGNSRIEVISLRPGSVARIIETALVKRGITSGKIIRVSESDFR